jgi:hypothetical protein
VRHAQDPSHLVAAEGRGRFFKRPFSSIFIYRLAGASLIAIEWRA